MDEIAEWIQQRIQEQGSPLLRCVRPLAVLRENQEPLAVGSAVLLWHRGQRYFVTAAHVLDAFPSHSYSIGSESRWITVSGPYRMTVAPGGDRDADHVDIGFGKVSAAAAAALDGCHFLGASQVTVSEKLQFDGPSRSKYLALGYPLNKFEFKRYANRTETPNLSLLANIVPEADHLALKVSVETHIAAEFDYKQVYTTTGPGLSPKLLGISGGGVFRFPIAERKTDLTLPTLTGIMIEQDKEKRRLLATRIGVVLSLIENCG
jgi:hypothetical protein